jgi:hypothetical protein
MARSPCALDLWAWKEGHQAPQVLGQRGPLIRPAAQKIGCPGIQGHDFLWV